MNANHIYLKLRHKGYEFIRTESRFYEVSDCIIPTNGPIANAAPTPDTTVADLLAQFEREQLEQKKAQRGASRMKRLQKEEVLS